MARTKSAVSSFPAAVVISAVVLAAFALAGAVMFCGKRRAARFAGPLDPGVRVRDNGSRRAACFSCEAQAGLAGSSPKCLTCTQPSFRYLTETIIAEQGAQRACPACRGAP